MCCGSLARLGHLSCISLINYSLNFHFVVIKTIKVSDSNLRRRKGSFENLLIVLMSMQYVQYLAFHSNQKGSPMITYLTKIPGLVWPSRQAVKANGWSMLIILPPLPSISLLH